MASSLAYDTMQVVAREMGAFGGSEVLGLAAIAFAIFIGGFVAVALWQVAGKVVFSLFVSISWSKWCCCCCGNRRRRNRKRHQHRRREYREEDELLGEVRPKQATHHAPKVRKRHPMHSLWHLTVTIGSILIVVSATFWALHVMHTPFSVVASLGIFGYIFGQAAQAIIANVFCGIILDWTNLVEIGDHVQIPGRGKGVVTEMHALWICLDDPNDDHTKDKKIFVNNSRVLVSLDRFDKWRSLINTKTK